MKTVRQVSPASNHVTDSSAQNDSDERDQSAGHKVGHQQSIDVEIASCAHVRVSSSNVNLPDLLQKIGFGQTGSTSGEPLMHISISHNLHPNTSSARRVRQDLLIEPSVLWLLESTGEAGVGLEFGCWDRAITAVATPQRLGWLIRLLLPIALPSHGLLPGHGAAYLSAREFGTVMSGLPNSGKTGATLAAVAGGGKFLADDLVIVNPALGQLYGTTLPVSVAYSYLQSYPQFQARVPTKAMMKLRLKSALLAGLRGALPSTLVSRLFPRRLSKRWTNFLNTRLVIELPKTTLFEPGQLASEANMNQLVVLIAGAGNEGSTSEMSEPLARTRWLLAMEKDTTEIRELYSQYRYAQPGATCQLLEEYTATLGKLLAQMGSPCALASVVVDWQQPNPELIHSGIDRLSSGD